MDSAFIRSALRLLFWPTVISGMALTFAFIYWLIKGGDSIDQDK